MAVFLQVLTFCLKSVVPVHRGWIKQRALLSFTTNDNGAPISVKVIRKKIHDQNSFPSHSFYFSPANRMGACAPRPLDRYGHIRWQASGLKLGSFPAPFGPALPTSVSIFLDTFQMANIANWTDVTEPTIMWPGNDSLHVNDAVNKSWARE